MSCLPGELVIFGVSNILSDIFDCARALGFTVKRIIQNQPEVVRERTRTLAERIELLPSPPTLHTLEEFVPSPSESYFIGLTSPSKSILVDELKSTHGLEFCSLVHPTSYVSPYACLGEGAFVGANTVLAPGTNVGNQVFINRGVNVGHDVLIQDYARIFAGSNIGGHSVIRHGATIGMGAAVIEEQVIGAGAFVAAGAVVINDVEEGCMVAGIPAVLKKRLS